MKAIMLMFDSLNRAMLSPYGCDTTITPNFKRLAEHTVRFDNCYAGSLPCMPARRELHTGRFNFLHRSWGPVEPFDDSMPEILKNNGICSVLISDHTHYWEDGGATYHTRYSAWQNIRGQEGDPWMVTPELLHGSYSLQNTDAKYFQITGKMHQQDKANRLFSDAEPETPLALTFKAGLEFMDLNHGEDNWFLQIECFDPHEPFHVPDSFKDLYPDAYEGDICDWPPYHHVTEDALTKEHLQNQYKALLTMCDAYLGKFLDRMDTYDLWKDTLLIVNTDHGYLLGEHGWWSKVCMPWYDELCHLPFFLHDPRCPEADGTSRDQIVQTIDIAPTLLAYFGLPVPGDMQGKDLALTLQGETIHDYALFGVHGAHVNVYDGRYVYMKAPVSAANGPLYEYTLMPTHMRARFGAGELKNAELTREFAFTKDIPVLKIAKQPAMGQDGFGDILMDRSHPMNRTIDNNSLVSAVNFGDKLYDHRTDPGEENSLEDPVLHAYMANLLVRAMKENEAPAEQYERIGLPADRTITPEDILESRAAALAERIPDILPDHTWTPSGRNAYLALMKFSPTASREHARSSIEKRILEACCETIHSDVVLTAIPDIFPDAMQDMIYYFASLAARDR